MSCITKICISGFVHPFSFMFTDKCEMCFHLIEKMCQMDILAALKACYGRSDAESVERVKALYDSLEMPLRYHHYEEESYLRLQSLIQRHAQNLPHAVFLNFAKKIYKRKKWGKGSEGWSMWDFFVAVHFISGVNMQSVDMFKWYIRKRQLAFLMCKHIMMNRPVVTVTVPLF